MDLAAQALGAAIAREALLPAEARRTPESAAAGPEKAAEAVETCRKAYTALLATLPPGLGTGVHDTPNRAAKAWAELTGGYNLNAQDVLKTFPAEGYDEMVVVKGIPFYSLCEHHLLPFHGEANIGYIPNGRIVGLSKLARLVDMYARRLQVQERLTDQIADALQHHVEARGVIVVIEAEHLCMTMRGVQKPGSRTMTSVVRGLLKDDARARSEALTLMTQP